MNNRSKKGILTDKCEGRLKEILIVQGPAKCFNCASPEDLTLFHILTKGAYPQLRFLRINLLLACLDCHQKWETRQQPERDEMESVIRHRLGVDDYRQHIISQREYYGTYYESTLKDLSKGLGLELASLKRNNVLIIPR